MNVDVIKPLNHNYKRWMERRTFKKSRISFDCGNVVQVQFVTSVTSIPEIGVQLGQLFSEIYKQIYCSAFFCKLLQTS